jgi:hypothetical protein
MRKSTGLVILTILTTLAAVNMPAHAAKSVHDFADARNSTVAIPTLGQGSRCVTDEGYGRWSYCDSN